MLSGFLLRIAAACAFATALFAQDPVQLLPKNYRLVFQNDLVRVIHVTYAPLEKLPVHSHSEKPTVYVYLNDCGPVRFSHVEQKPFSLVRPPEKAGTFRFSPGRIEQHDVENLGNTPSEFLRIELTKLPLGYHKAYFKSGSFDANRGGIRSEFDSPNLRIRRIVALAGRRLDVPAEGASGLVIALSPTSLSRDGRNQSLAPGEVAWIDARGALQIAGPGHALEILLPDGK